MAHICTECGEQEDGNWMPSVALKLAEERLCHSCEFWISKIAIAARADVARIRGTHYIVGKETDSKRGFRGFGGAAFEIKFADGRQVSTSNLWCQGEIPERFRARLPDNAEFVADRLSTQEGGR